MYMEIEEVKADLETEQIADTVAWLTGLPSRFPTHRSAERLRALFEKIAAASVYDPGETDLDSGQPVSLTIDLGDVRMARMLLR